MERPPASSFEPEEIVCWSPIDQRIASRLTPRHRNKDSKGNWIELRPVWFVIAKADEHAFFLYGCSQDWRCVTDTFHETIEEAKRQAEFEWPGAVGEWSHT
jgi:hypothetical protein